MKYFCIIKEKIVYMECIIQKSMFYSFYLFLSILHSNVDSALVSDSNVFFLIFNCIQMLEFMFECWRNVFLVHPHSLHQELTRISQLHQELVHVYEKKKGRGKGWGGGGGGYAWRNYWIAPLVSLKVLQQLSKYISNSLSANLSCNTSTVLWKKNSNDFVKYL